MARMSDIGGFLMRSQIQILALCVLSTLVHAANTGDGAEPITAPIHPREHDAVRSDRVLVALPDTVKQFFLATMRQNLSDISEIWVCTLLPYPLDIVCGHGRLSPNRSRDA